MKKRFAIALMSLVMIPCLLLLTACKKTISASDYQEKVHKAAISYYDNYGGEDMKVVYTGVEDSSWTQEVTRTQGTETFKEEFTFTSKTETTQTIELDAGATKNAKITTVEKTTETGTKAKTDQSGFEAYTETTERTTVVTLVDDATTQKAYKTVEVKEDGEVKEAQAVKSVYTYTDAEDYADDINELFYNLDERMISNYFETEAILSFRIYGESETYKDGKIFGMEASMMMAGSFNDSSDHTEYGAEMVKLNIEMNFKNDKPNEYRLENSSNSTGRSGMKDLKSSSVDELVCSYEVTVTAPTGFVEDDATTTPIELPTLQRISFGF